ncbi:MAG TPA: TolC family protein [Hyphomicrobiales bacterium]|nr:TolC family protein [Hyphomicrobiales bacterium]
MKTGALALAFLAMGGCTISPDALDQAELRQLLNQDQEVIARIQIPVQGPLTLSDIMARAVLTNLDQRVSNLQEALALGAFEMARYDMLPSAALSSTYYDRNNENASRSISVLTRQESLEPSTSQEPQHTVSDMRLSWNLLDFGVSYYQAKQEADRYLIAQANRRKALIDLLQEARGAYWRALAAQRLSGPVEEVIREATTAYDDVNRGIENQVYPSMVEALRLKKELFTLIGDLKRLQAELEQARILLANFINVPTNTQLVLVGSDELPALPAIDAKVENLEQLALENSSELLQEAYNSRIEHAETRKALLRLLPGIELGYTGNYDTNKYLYNNDWNEASLRVSWNLLRLASTRQTLKNADLRDDLQLQRRLAANMAVVTRVNLALHQYASRMSVLETARELQNIDSQIAQYTSNAVTSSSEAQMNLVRTQAEALTASLTYLQSYAQVQEAYGAVLVSLGMNPLPDNYNSLSVDQLSNLLASDNAQWLQGTLPLSSLELEADVDPAVSPLAPSDVATVPDAVQPTAAVNLEDEVEAVVATWLDSQNQQDVERYFSYYLPSYSPVADLSEAEWRESRLAALQAQDWTDAGYQDFQLLNVHDNTATVRFRVAHAAEAVEKEMRMTLVNGRWQIVMERDVDTGLALR